MHIKVPVLVKVPPVAIKGNTISVPPGAPAVTVRELYDYLQQEWENEPLLDNDTPMAESSYYVVNGIPAPDSD